MEIASKIIFVFLFIVLIAIMTYAIIFFSLMREMRVINKRNKKLQEDLSIEEAKFIKLTKEVSLFNEKVAAHISMIVLKSSESSNITCSCTEVHKHAD